MPNRFLTLKTNSYDISFGIHKQFQSKKQGLIWQNRAIKQLALKFQFTFFLPQWQGRTFYIQQKKETHESRTVKEEKKKIPN